MGKLLLGIDVVELGDEVGVARARGRVERHRDRPVTSTSFFNGAAV
jgi:hypothetical protein